VGRELRRQPSPVAYPAAVIKFRIGTIPVSIKPTFWIVAVILGLPVPARHSHEMFSYLVGWIGVVVFSVLAHELGHALAARRFGAEVEITLHVMGGYTTWATPQPISPLRRVLVAAAGSGVGFLLAGATFGVVRGFDISIDNRLFASLASAFVFVNIVWGVFNWLPIRPLDGGHILSGFLQAALGRKATIVLDVIFPITTVAVGLLAYRQGLIFAAFFCGFLLLDEMRNWQSRRPSPPPAPGGGLPPALG
jgi:stage IV sporulation protein FB